MVPCGDNGVRVGALGEGLGFGLVVLGDDAVDGGLQIDDRVKDAVFEPALRELSEDIA